MNKRIILSAFVCFAPFAQAADRVFGVAGDGGKISKESNMVRESLKGDGVFDLIMPGDNLYKGDYETVWFQWLEDDFKFEVTAIGNHHDGYANEVKFFQMPDEYFSKTYDDRVRFIVLNSDNFFNVKEQMDFLDSELEAAKEPFVFLVYHHPTYTVSHYHKWTERKLFQTELRRRLSKYRSKLTGLILGHDHAAMAVDFGDLPAIVSGAVHEVRIDFPINNTQDGVKVATRWYFDWKPTWVKLTVPEVGDEVKIEFVRAVDSLVRCTARLKTGASMALNADCAKNSSSNSNSN